MDNIEEHPRLPIDLNESGEPEGDTPREGMCFVSGAYFSRFFHEYAYREGFELFIKSTDLLKEFKDAGVCRSGVGEKEAKADMMKQTFKRAIINDNAGISINRNFSAQVLERGGFDNMNFNNRDLRNAINVDRRMSRCLGDAKALQDYLKKQHGLNNDFYSCLQVDDGGTLLNAFWSDARSRDSYKYFGDVIKFDTTFSVNRFRMSFAPFIGINHHGSSIIFGAALIMHEDTETFVWMFEQFLKFCLWHLLQNAVKNLGSNANWKDIDRLIRTTVHDMMDQEEFDEAWCIIMDNYGLREAG
ncbi:protein FAR1-RELATED SEQUENCE 5-like [Spinacia oleracea]|uniref:Protein FAR1-RELATED SEQUENCE 5-like n=1 Tax=Spinacia oleracea TaxID=3562 RepID=A0ABM3R7S8_SPIOL|nr:protein FAR1-RELATED SEQUENCE 5-like [Spinacia oleracea]